MDTAFLTLPHPRAAGRAFVLLPWLELDRDAWLPGTGRVAGLLPGTDAQDVRVFGSLGWRGGQWSAGR
jgi:7,8-dihydro-6-hydroxymethylpterin-pyrophosphokinase